MAKKTTSTAAKKKEQERLNQGGQNIANIAQNIVARRQEQAVNKTGQQYGIRRTAGDMMATRALGTIQDREMLSYRKRLEEEERRRREAEAARQQNVAGNLRSAAMRVNNGGMAGNPTQEKLRKSSLETIMDGLKAKIGNEQKIINEQGRAEDDPARIRAEKELKDLEKRMAGTQAKIASIPTAAAGNGVTAGISGYTPEEEAYIQRLQKKLERGQSKKQTIPAVWNPDLKAIQHMRNAPEKAEGDEYIRWLQEGGQIGLYDGKTTNALIAQAGKSDDPLAQYMALDDSQKSGWLRSAGKDLNSIISMRAAKEYNQAHPYATDRDELLEKQNYFTGLRDEAQGALDRMNGNIRIMYRPDDGEEYEIRGRSNPYYQQNPEAINEQFYDALVGPGEYRKRKAEFTDDPEGWEKADQLELQLTEAWDAYEQGRWNDAYRILTGKNNYAEMESQLGYANDQLNEIQGQLNLYDQYDAFMGGYTGAQRGSYDPAKDRGFDSLVDYGTRNNPNHRPAYRDPNTKDVHRVYSFINQGKEYKAYIDNATGGDENAAKIDAVYGKSALMLPEEIEIFNGYYNAGQYNEAGAFLNGLGMALNDRYAKYEEIENREQARKYPVLSSFETLLAEQMSGALAIPRTFAGFAGEKSVYDPNSAWYASSRYTEQTQDEIANMIGGEGGKFYLQGMNTLRNLTNAAMVALAGVPASGQAAAGLAMFAAQIYQDQTYKYLKETNDYGKAAGLATLDAVLETMEEMLPYEVMLSGGGNIILDILANSTSEALEELTGATVGEAIKGLITGRQDWEKRRDQIFNEGGYTDDSGNWIALDAGDSNKAMAEAQTQAWKEKGHEIIENTVAGFVGGSMGASYGQVRNYLHTRSTGVQVNSREGGFNTLLTAARGMEENSATRKLAEQLYAKQQKGKTISNYQAGKLAQTMYQESGQEIRDVIEGAMTRKVEGELKAEGASDEYAEEAAPIIAQAVTTGKTMRKAEIKAIAKEDAGMVLMASYLKGEKNAAESIKKAGGEAAMNANQAVRDVLGEKQTPVNMKKSKEELLKYAPVAKAEELEAATGTRHENGLDAVVDKQMVQVIGRKGDQYIILDENNNERTVNKNDVRAAGENLGLLMEYADRNRNIIDDDTFREIALGMKDNPEIDIDEYLNESARTVINYRTGGEVTNSKLAESTLNALKSTAKRLNDEWDQERTAKAGNQRKATPGKGIVTYKGIKAGTEEWENTAKKAGPLLGNQLRIIGEIGVRLGNEIEIVEREDMPDAFGWQDPETGKIYVNLAAENVKGIKNNRHVLTVTAHELTHWLEQNSPEEYKALRNFVFNNLRNSGMDIASRVMERIDNFRGVMGKEMTVNEALAEIVADACDQVLTNEQVAKQLEAESPNLYQKIKTFVKNFIDTVRKYAGTIDTSKESRKMMQAGPDALDEMARIWLGARSEALGRQTGNQAEAKAQESTGEKRMSTREAEDQGIKNLEYALAHPHVKFSMREPIEATKDGLVAVHNLTWENLWDTLNEGGFTAPSIAVIRAAMGHTKYGNISAVIKPSAINPETNRLNKIYGADAYTPTRYNAHVETELEYKQLQKISDEIAGYVKGMDEHLYNEVQRWFSEQAYREVTTKTPEEMADDASNNEALMAAYLNSQGKEVPIKTRERFVNPDLRAEDIDSYQKAFELIMDNADLTEFMKDVDELSGRNLVEKYGKIIEPANERIGTLLNVWNEKQLDIAGKSLMRWMKRTRDYIRGGSEKITEPDWYETRKAMWDIVDMQEYKKWLADKIRPMFGQKGIRNNLDPYTYSGRSRTFKQLHTPYTIENVVKAMYQNAKEKGEGGRYAKGVVATSSKEYKNLKEVRDDAARLHIEDEEKYDELYEELDQRIRELGEEIMPDAAQYFDEVLMTAGKYYARRQTTAAIQRGFAEEQYNITAKQAEEVKKLLDDMREIPTGYFEAKPMRVMGFEDLAMIIIPENAGEMMFSKLDENKIPYEMYDGTEEDRLKKLNSVENVQFSTRELDNQYMQAVKNRDRATEQLMVDAQAIKSGFTTEDAFHGTTAFGFNRFDMEASGGAIFVAYSPKIAGTYVDNGEVRMIGKKYPDIGLDIMSAEQLAEELQEYYQNLPKSLGYETANEWTVKGIDRDDYVDFVLDYAENMKKLAAGKSFEKEVTRLVDKMVALAHTGDEKAAYQVGVDLQRKFRTADYFGQDELENRRLELSAMMIPALAKGEDVININMHGINYYLSRSDVIRQLEKYSQDQEGIYRFYTRPGNQLLIDAKGANWNKIWIEDEQLRNDIWAYFNQKEALEEAQGIKTYSKDMFTVTTRQLSEYARYKKYSSVRINDVYDHGGRGDWDRERGHGDIAMFFNPNDVKSADPVTYDDSGKVVPLNKRFSDNDDLRFSNREPDMEVNHWMMGLTDSSLRTVQERMLWKQYKGVRLSWELAKHAIHEQNEQLKKLEAKNNKTAMDTFEIEKIKKQIEKWEEKKNEYEEQLLKVTTDKGYAAIMYRERNKMENLLNGRTEDEVRQTIDAIQAELDTVAREMAQRNERLKELAEKENVKRIRQQLNSAGLRRIAAKLKEDLGSELQNKEIENRLALLALKMKQGKVDSTEIMELADMLVGSMRPAYDDYVLSELRGMTIGLNSSELETLKNRGMNIRDLQRELTGTGIRVVAGGPNTIDKNWEELTGALPNLDPAANPGDMLWGPDTDHKGLMDLAEDAIRQQKTMGPDSDQVAAMVLEAASDLVPEILTDAKSMQMIRETMEFIAEINQSTEALDNINALFDRLKKKNAHAKATLGVLENKIVDAIEYNNELAKQHDVTAWRQERRAIIEQLKDKHTKEMLELQEKYRKKIAKDKKARDLMADNNALRREIHMDIAKYRRLIVNETDRENVPEAYKPLAREMLMKIIRNDLAEDRKVTAIDKEKLADAFHFLSGMNARDGRFSLEDLQMLPEDVQDEVEDALSNIDAGLMQYNDDTKGKDIIENLTKFRDGLEQIAEAVNLITNVINKARSISYMDRERKLDDEAARVIRDLRRIKKEPVGKGSKSINAIRRSVFYGNMTPVYFFKNLKNAGIFSQWEEFEAEENRNGLELTKAKEFFDKVAEDCHYKSWDLDKKYTVSFNNYPMQVTTEQIMALYATWQREKMIGPEESHHLETGGVILDDGTLENGKLRMEKKEQKARKVKDGDMAKMLQLLTTEQKQYVHKIVSYLSKEMSDLGNEASMRMYGIKKYNEKWYFPFKVWNGVLSARSDKGITGTDENRAAHKGWSKRRKNNAGNALVIGNFTDTAVKHVVEMINYNTFAPAIENLNKILNYQTVEVDQNQEEERRNIRVMFQQAYGKEALRYLEDWMKDLQGGVTQDQRKTLRDRLISIFKKNAVAGSLSVTLQQPLSYIRAAMLINPKYLAGALSPQYWKGSYKEMMDHSGVAVIKQMGRFDMNFGKSAQDWIKPQAKPNVYEKISDVLTAAPQAADTMTWTRMWSAVKMEQHALHPDMDVKSDDFLDLVGKRFNEVMRRTQVYDSTLTKSSNMRSQALSMKLITSFMAEPTLSLNVLADAVMNVKQKGGKATLAKAGATYLLSAVLQAAVKGFMGAGRSPDEKKTAEENLLNKILYNLMSEANPASLIPGYSDLVEVLKNGELKDDALGVLGKLKSIYTTAQNIITNPDNSKGTWRDVEDTLGQFIQLFSNVPLKNLMRDARAMYNWATCRKFADRDTSGAVLKYQAQETLMNGDNLLGVINSWLGDAGYKSTSKAYYTRMYGAMTGGNQAEAEGIREYLELAKGQDSKKVQAGLRTAAREDDSKTPAEQSQWMIDNDLLDGTSSITTQYKKGEITREEAEGLYKAASPKMKDDDIFWKLDQMDYEKETGETETGYYYRMRDAITKNKADEIQAAVKTLLAHGITKEKIKDKLSDWKAEYTAGDSAKKIQIRDAITKAYKAAGYTADDANKTIERWNKEAKKAEPEKKDAKDTTGRWGRGNIDLNNRKVVENDDGTISTERSFSVNIDGKEVLLPTVIDGKIVSEEEAIRHYEQTGQYLGKFNTVKEAEEYAEKLHNRQDWYYNK